MASKPPAAPKHLSVESKAWWRQIVADYDLEPHHLRLLQSACECWDHVLRSRAAVERDGDYFTDRFGNLKPHPALIEERQNKILLARLIRELALDVDAPSDMVGRPPQIVPGSGRRSG